MGNDALHWKNVFPGTTILSRITDVSPLGAGIGMDWVQQNWIALHVPTDWRHSQGSAKAHDEFHSPSIFGAADGVAVEAEC